MGLDRIKVLSSSLLNISFCLLFTFSVLPNAMQSIVFFLFILSTIICNYRFDNKEFSIQKKIRFLIPITGYYIFYLFTFFYPSTLELQTSIIQSSFLLLIIPILLIFFQNSNVQISKGLIITIFTISNFILIFLIINYLLEGLQLSYNYYANDTTDFSNYEKVDLVTFFLTNSFEFINSLAEWGFKRDGQIKELNNHHAYLSAVINLNIIMLVSEAIYQTKYLKRILYILAIIILVLSVIYLNSKTNFLFLVIYILFLIALFFLKSKSYQKLLIISIIVTSSIFVLKKINYTSESYLEFVKDSERIKLYKNLYPIIKKHLPIGIGGNNINSEINLVMKQDSTSYIYSFNVLTNHSHAHSQYLHYLISGGVINLLLFIIMIAYLFCFFLKTKNIFGCLFILLIALNCLFEDFFNRAWGVYTFSLGLIYSWYYNLSKKT